MIPLLFTCQKVREGNNGPLGVAGGPGGLPCLTHQTPSKGKLALSKASPGWLDSSWSLIRDPWACSIPLQTGLCSGTGSDLFAVPDILQSAWTWVGAVALGSSHCGVLGALGPTLFRGLGRAQQSSSVPARSGQASRR